jgi:hypothetical protein
MNRGEKFVSGDVRYPEESTYCIKAVLMLTSGEFPLLEWSNRYPQWVKAGAVVGMSRRD